MINNFFKKFKPNSKGKAAKNEKGATLIELLVAVIIFSIVMIAVIGILISAIKANKRIIAKQENIDNARYSMEFMMKELRMAKASTPANLSFNHGVGVYDNLTFYILNPANALVPVAYSLSGDGKIMRNDGTGDQPISADGINVTALKFWINDWNLTQGPAGTAPLITIFMEMKGKTGAAVNEVVNLQSSVSPRIY